MASTERPQPLIDTLFPGRRVHLIGGASGSGKTTWLMQILERWRKAEPIYGYASHPVPFLYLSYDRGTDDFHETCERLRIDPTTYRFVAPNSREMVTPLVDYLRAAYKAEPFQLVIIEGLANQTPEGKINDQRVVGRWLRQLQELCEQLNFTIIGVLHSAKTKERERYREPRAKIAGCGAWAGYASTVVIIEEFDADGESELRSLMILPRNSRKHKYTLDFVDGFLVESKTGTTKLPKFVQWIMTMEPGQEFTTFDAKNKSGLAEGSLYGEIDRASKPPTNLIEKLRHGVYRVCPRNNG